MPYQVYTDGKNEVAVCEVRGTGQYFVATFEELGLEALEPRQLLRAPRPHQDLGKRLPGFYLGGRPRSAPAPTCGSTPG